MEGYRNSEKESAAITEYSVCRLEAHEKEIDVATVISMMAKGMEVFLYSTTGVTRIYIYIYDMYTSHLRIVMIIEG